MEAAVSGIRVRKPAHAHQWPWPWLACPSLLQARIQRETNDAKNALEAYIYGLRNKL